MNVYIYIVYTLNTYNYMYANTKHNIHSHFYIHARQHETIKQHRTTEHTGHAYFDGPENELNVI